MLEISPQKPFQFFLGHARFYGNGCANELMIVSGQYSSRLIVLFGANPVFFELIKSNLLRAIAKALFVAQFVMLAESAPSVTIDIFIAQSNAINSLCALTGGLNNLHLYESR